MENCDCLPLAVKVLGGVLRRKSKTRDTWTDICNYTWPAEGIDRDIDRAVYLSYEDLPSHLKQCFLYCSLFPKDELIRLGDIVRLWIAQGYIQDKITSKTLEDLGEDYYKELLSRNLLDPDKRSYGQTACTMHDVIRSCAQSIIKDEGVLISGSQDVSRTLISTTKLRHLSISNKTVMIDTLQKQVSLRTLMLFGSTMVELKDLLSHLSCLRVLSLDNVNLVELPDSICHLKHLRNLCLSGTSISTIPRDIGDLKFLEDIDLFGCRNVSRLPNSILKLQKLNSLNLIGTTITSIPCGFHKLKDLVNLCGFPTDSNDSTDGWCSLEELGPLSKLKQLNIKNLEKAPSGSMAAKAMLSNKHHLISLDLIFTSRLGENWVLKDDISEEEHERIGEVLANLCPPTCIENLEIRGYFARGLPQWMRAMSAFGSLSRFVLKDYACCMQLPNGLGQLPFLDHFWIERAPSIQGIGHDLLLPSHSLLGDDGDGASVQIGEQNKRRQPHHISHGTGAAFPKLRNLGFIGMFEWTEWEWEQHVVAMPVLESLRVQHCKLQCFPIGLAHHASQLRYLTLQNISHLVSIENFPSLVKLWSYNNPRLERISNNKNLEWIDISSCPALKELDRLPSLQSLEWWDLRAKALPQYLQKTKLNKLHVDCSPSLLKLIALQDDSSEWGKIKHVQELKAYGRASTEDEVDRHIYYTKEPYSFDVYLGESTGAVSIIFYLLSCFIV